MDTGRVSRRELLAAGAAAGAALALTEGRVAGAFAASSHTLDFATLGAGEGWPGWTCAGAANLRREDGQGLLEAASDVFPTDPRPVAFAVDRRFCDGEIAARINSAGAGTGLVLRRVGPRQYYAAAYDQEQGALVILRRFPAGVEELARAPVVLAEGPLRLSFAARGAHPTALAATLDTGLGSPVSVSAQDSTRMLQRPGDPGVLATARTLFPSQGPPVLPALGNLHLLPYGVQEGQAVMQTAVGEAVLAQIRERSTAAFAKITVRSRGGRDVTSPSVVAATTAAPVAGGARVRVAADVPALVEIEVAGSPDFHGSRILRVGDTNSFDAVTAAVRDLPVWRPVYWRALLHRNATTTVGPVRSFRTLPRSGSGDRARIAIAACASQFGPGFDALAARDPDAFVWQGDLNYPDTMGPLAQTNPGYAGIWRDFLANPRMEAIYATAMFAVQRDDHDYGIQDANSTNLLPWGLEPWEGLMEDRPHYRFSAGLADFWVLDQRRFKSDPTAPDTADKTLLGLPQREWLLRTLEASSAPFKVVCSPCTLAPLPANARDGSWAAGFTAERDLLLDHIAQRVSGRTLFVTGDTHWTMAYDRGGLFEARPCPLCIPAPNDITLTQPTVAEDARGRPGVLYADDETGHFALLDVRAADGRARLDLRLVREDGMNAYHAGFDQALP